MDRLKVVIGLLSSFWLWVGMLSFGTAAGWFTLTFFQADDLKWQLQALVYGVFFAFVAGMAAIAPHGAFGAFLIGAAAAFVFWGILKRKQDGGGD